jgi:hypothetical protein
MAQILQAALRYIQAFKLEAIFFTKHGDKKCYCQYCIYIFLKDTICFTISEGLCRSITLLWIRIWKRSHVFEPSPQGVLRVVMRRVFVGIRTGPFTRRFCFFAPLIKSAHTEKKIIVSCKCVLLLVYCFSMKVKHVTILFYGTCLFIFTYQLLKTLIQWKIFFCSMNQGTS